MSPITIYLTFALFSFSCTSPSIESKITIQTPSIQQEASSIWRTIRDIRFFEKAGYTVNLPKSPLIDQLISKSKNNSFGNDDFPSIVQLLESGVYNKADYALAQKKVESQMALIQGMVQELESSKDSWNWDFKMYENYQVVFTLYGSGGSYDPDQGIITLYTNPEGGFKNYKNPANTIIHEIVHIGIEQSLVQNLQLPHTLKERVVDKVVKVLFGEKLPKYRLQNMGETRIDAYLKSKEDIKGLDASLKKLME